MTPVRLRITHATTATEYVYGDVVLSDDALVSRTSISAEGAVEVGGVTVVVTDASILGETAKPLPAGRHRAVVERETSPGVWTAIADGTVSNERTSCSSTYATPASGPHAGAAVRRWTIEVADTALADAIEALEGVTIADEAAGTSVETAVAEGGGTVSTSSRLWYDVLDAMDDLATAAGLTLAAPATAIGEPTGALHVSSPHPDRGTTAPDWTGADLLDLWRAIRPTIVSAAYGTYPSASVTLTVEHGPYPSDYVTGELVDLDDVSGDRAWEQGDWTTEPAATDGEVYDDLAVVWEGGPDGSRIDSQGVLDAPLAATYAAARPRLLGTLAPARDGGREAGNAHVLELPARLPGHESASLATASDGAGGDIDTARPAIDIAADTDNVYAAVLVDVSGSLRSIVERRPSGSSATMELWAEAIYGGVSARYADRDALRIAVPLSLVASVDVGEVSTEAEGLAWSAESIDRGHDSETAQLTLVRPTALAPVAPAIVGSGRLEPAPNMQASVDESGATSLLVVDAIVSYRGEVPDSVEIEAVSGEPASSVLDGPDRVDVDALSPNGRHWRLTGEAFGGDSYDGSEWRARATYPSGTVSAWSTVIASL